MVVRPESFGQLREKSVLFGDDEWGLVADERPPYKHPDTGIEMKQYLIVPHPHLVKTYPMLQRKDSKWYPTRYGDAIWVEYPTYWISDSNNSRTNSVCRIYCGFDGRETSETRRVKRYTEQIHDMQMENDRLIWRLEVLKEENKELVDLEIKRAEKYQEMFQKLKGDNKNDKPDEFAQQMEGMDH